MSSSDEKKPVMSSSKWQPLVPEQLEQCEADPDIISERKDPELEKQFMALYEQHMLEKRKFSLLYATGEEEDEQDDSVPGEEDEEPQLSEEPVEDSEKVSEPDTEAIEKAAYEKGFSKGEKDGYEKGLAAAAEKTERIAGILHDIDKLWLSLISSCENRIIELVAKVSEKVVYGSVSVDNEIITRAIMDVFQKIPDPVEAVITVNPLDYEYIEVVKDDFFELINGLKQVRIVSDQLIAPGGCRIETKAGEVDTSIEERLEAVKKSIITVAAGT